jgi:hypothetical protein
MHRARSMLLSVALISACSPALNWRQVRLTDIGLEAQFPCKPAALARDVLLSGKRLPMQLHGCAADGSTYAVGSLALDDVRDVAPALDALKAAAAQNLQAPLAAARAIAVPGMTPNPRAGQVVLAGRRPNGSAVVQHLLVFARGTRVYQASVLGDGPQESAVQQFFGAIRAA